MKTNSVSQQAASIPAAPKCVLVVEDELLIRVMLAEQLRDNGLKVIETCSADEALVVIDTTVPDLIISDVRMPGSMDGMGLLEVVRKTYPVLPVIITSGHLEGTVALTDGASHFIAKPYSYETIVKTVQSELAKA